VLLRLAYLTVTNTFAVLRLLPMTDRDKDVEILALRHQIGVLQRHLGPRTVAFTPADRAFLAALLQPLLPCGPAPPATAGPAGHGTALAPRPDQSAAREHFETETARTATDRTLHPHPHQAMHQAAPLRAVPTPITDPTGSPTWTSAATTDSASSTNTSMRPELHGRNFRQAQGQTATLKHMHTYSVQACNKFVSEARSIPQPQVRSTTLKPTLSVRTGRPLAADHFGVSSVHPTWLTAQTEVRAVGGGR
jgi:hypothetical protein